MRGAAAREAGARASGSAVGRVRLVQHPSATRQDREHQTRGQESLADEATSPHDADFDTPKRPSHGRDCRSPGEGKESRFRMPLIRLGWKAGELVHGPREAVVRTALPVDLNRRSSDIRHCGRCYRRPQPEARAWVVAKAVGPLGRTCAG